MVSDICTIMIGMMLGRMCASRMRELAVAGEPRRLHEAGVAPHIGLGARDAGIEREIDDRGGDARCSVTVLPSAATMPIASTNSGNAMMVSAMRPTMRSVQPPKKPAAMPASPPMREHQRDRRRRR